MPLIFVFFAGLLSFSSGGIKASVNIYVGIQKAETRTQKRTIFMLLPLLMVWCMWNVLSTLREIRVFKNHNNIGCGYISLLKYFIHFLSIVQWKVCTCGNFNMNVIVPTENCVEEVIYNFFSTETGSENKKKCLECRSYNRCCL